MSTSTSVSPPLNYYGKYLFSHSPTYCRWSRLTAKDIHTTLYRRAGFEGQDIWFYLNHPIRWVRIVGIVVAYDELENRILLTIDDGSGYTIDLISWTTLGFTAQKYPPADLTGVGLHSVVKVKGSVNEFRGVKQMLVKKVTVLKDTNEEVMAWRETTKFKREILSKPWFISAEIIEREKRKISGETVDEERLKKRKRRKMEKMEKIEKLKKLESEVAKEKREENILWDNLVEKFSQEDRAKRQREGRKEERNTHRTQETDTKYCGHRRPPNANPPPPALEFSIPENIDLCSTSTLQGHPRTTPAPTVPIATNPTSISTFRGRRRTTPAPTVPIAAEIPQEPEPESIYRGHRRTSKPPTDLSLSRPTPAPIPPEPDPIEISTYRGHRRTSRPPVAPLDVVPPLLKSHVVETSTYRGHRRTSKKPKPTPDTVTMNTPVEVLPEGGSVYRDYPKASESRGVLTPIPIPEELFDPVMLSSAESSMYYEQRRTPKSRDGVTLTLDHLPETLRSMQPSQTKSTYRGHRRALKVPEGGQSQPPPTEALAYSQNRLQELTSTLLPQSSRQCTSYRDLQRLIKSQKNEAEIDKKSKESLMEDDDSQPERKKIAVNIETSSRSQVPSRSSYSRKRRESGPPDIQAALSSLVPSVISTYVPSQSQVSESSNRGKNWKGDIQTDTQELLEFSDFVPTPMTHSTEVESSFKGGQRLSRSQAQIGTQESFLESLEFSDFIPSQSQASVSIREGSSFRGRRRSKPATSDLKPPYSLGGLPHSGNPSQMASPVFSSTTPQVSSSTYRGRRRE